LAGELVLGFQFVAVVHEFVVPTHVEVIVAPCAGARQSTSIAADARYAAARHDRRREPFDCLEINPSRDPEMRSAIVSLPQAH
jgi:hypothetical protein